VRTNVYIDGFNLYYGSLKQTPFRWLDVDALCRRTLQRQHVIHKIRYFTARVQPRPSKPQTHVKQQTYIRALETIPHLSVHYGHYLTKEVTMLLAAPVPGESPFVRVVKTEEKGSDVNLATYLLLDGFRNDSEAAVIISNDSDLKTPIEVTRRELHIDCVGIINPHSNTSNALKDVAKFYLSIKPSALRASQFPQTLTDSDGRTITKPANW
jgi:uncharacterized LabA/DUF88 family protein